MRFDVELVQRVRIFDRVLQREVLLRTYAHILAALAGAATPLTREELILRVWPAAPLPAGRNRLRVALTNFRQRMPGAIVESKEGLRLDPEVVRVDLVDAAAQIRLAENTVTRQSEFEALGAALLPFGDGTHFAAFKEFVGPLFDAIAGAAKRHHELARFLNERGAAISSADLMVNLTPTDRKAWEAFIQAYVDAGRGEDALQTFRRNAPFGIQNDSTLQELLRTVRNPVEGVQDCFRPEESALLLGILQRLEESRLDLWRAILSAPEGRVLAGRQPRVMHDLLERAIPAKLESRDEVWERSAARLCGLKAWLGNAAGVLALSKEILQTSKDPTILRATWNAIAIAHSINRDWEPAFEALGHTAEYARLTGNVIDEISTEGNRAFFMIHQTRFDEAEAAYRSQAERLAQLDTEQARFELAIASGYQALIPVYRQDWPEAVQRLDQAIAIRAERSMNVQLGLLQTALALALAQQDQLADALPLLRAGFLDAFGADSVATQQATFEFAAGTLSTNSQFGYAVAVLDWVENWRAQTKTPRSRAEAELCQAICVRRPPKRAQIGTEITPAAVGRELMRRLRQEVQRSLLG